MPSGGARTGRARLFFALWPPDAVRRALDALAAELCLECGGRAIARENIHLTLFFVGAFERSRVEALHAAATSVSGEAFELAIDRIGYWRHNRIAWAGASRTPRALIGLEAALRAALASIGVHAEERPYAPHVTLVRNAERKPAARAVPPCVWSAHEFTLVESVPVAKGVRYEPVASWPLSAV